MRKYGFLFLLLALLCLTGCSSDFSWQDLSLISDWIASPTETTAEPTETYAPIRQATYLDTYTDPETNKAIDYHMYIPKNATENMPLVVYLHGIGAVGANHYNEENPMITKALEIYGEEFPFLILAPSSMYNKTWISKQMPERVKALVEAIAEQFNVDRSKIIITGHSMGAAGVFRQIELYGDFYSAAIPVSVPDISIFEMEKLLEVSIWGLAGSKEPADIEMRAYFEALAALGGQVKYTSLEGVEHGKSANYAFLWDVLEWAIAQ